jgi:hypothetical protein
VAPCNQCRLDTPGHSAVPRRSHELWCPCPGYTVRKGWQHCGESRDDIRAPAETIENKKMTGKQKLLKELSCVNIKWIKKAASVVQT